MKRSTQIVLPTIAAFFFTCVMISPLFSQQPDQTITRALMLRLKESEIEPTRNGVHEFLTAMRPTAEWEERAESLIRQLSSKKFKIRQRATRELATMPLPPLQALRNALDSADTEVTYRTRRILAEIARGRHESRLLQVLLLIRRAKFQQLERELIGASVIWDNPQIRWELARTLAETASQKSDQVLRETMTAGHRNERIVAMLATTMLHPDSAIEMLEKQSSAYDWHRLAVSEAMANLGSPKCLSRFVKELDVESQTIQRWCLEYLQATTGVEFVGDSLAARAEQCREWWKTTPAVQRVRYPLFDALVGRDVLKAGGLVATEPKTGHSVRWLRHWPDEKFRLTRIDLTQAKITESTLGSLSALPDLQVLMLQGTWVRDEHLMELGDLLSLRSLSLRGCQKFTDLGMSALRRMPSLLDLDLGETLVSGVSIQALGAIQQLRSLDLYRCRNVADRGFDAISKLKALEELNLEGTTVTAASLDQLEFLPNLKRLEIGKLTTDSVLSRLSLSRLESLKISHAPITGKGLSHLVAANRLRELQLYRCNQVSDAALVSIGQIRSLRRLSLVCPDVGDDGVRALAGLRELESLSLQHSSTTGGGFEPLSDLVRLKSLNLGHTKLNDDGLRMVGNLERLEELHLRNSKITDKGMKHLNRLTQLRRLVLDGNAIRGSGLKELGPLKSLTELSLYNVRLDESELGAISVLPSLRDLDVSNTPIGNNAIRHFKGLMSLERLNIAKTTVSNEGLDGLRDVPALREVNVRLTRVTKPAMDAFTKKYPRIVFFRSYSF